MMAYNEGDRFRIIHSTELIMNESAGEFTRHEPFHQFRNLNFLGPHSATSSNTAMTSFSDHGALGVATKDTVKKLPVSTGAPGRSGDESFETLAKHSLMTGGPKKQTAGSHFSRKTSGSTSSQKSKFSMASSLLSAKSVLTGLFRPKAVDNESLDSPQKPKGLLFTRRQPRRECTVEETDMEEFYKISVLDYPYRYNRALKYGCNLEFHAALHGITKKLEEYHLDMEQFVTLIREWTFSLNDPLLKIIFEQIYLALSKILDQTRTMKSSLDADPQALGFPIGDGDKFVEYANVMFGDNGLYDQVRRAEPQGVALEPFYNFLLRPLHQLIYYRFFLRHAITSRRTPRIQNDAELGLRINSMDRITRKVDILYGKLGMVDSFDDVIKYEDSLDVFHCYSLDCTPNYSRNPDYQTVMTSLTLPRLEPRSPLPVAPLIEFLAVFVDGDKNSRKKRLFGGLKKDVTEVPDTLNGGSNVVVTPSRMQERYLEVMLLSDTLIICKVDRVSPRERRLLFPPIPITDATMMVLPGRNNSLDISISDANILRLVELEAGEKDQFASTFDRLKKIMQSRKEPRFELDQLSKRPTNVDSPLESEGPSVQEATEYPPDDSRFEVLSLDAKAPVQIVNALPQTVQTLTSMKCSLSRWDRGDGNGQPSTWISLGTTLFRIHAQNARMFVTLSTPSTGCIIISDNVGPATEPRSDSTGLIRLSLFNRQNELKLYQLHFSEPQHSTECIRILAKGLADWIRRFSKFHLSGCVASKSQSITAEYVSMPPVSFDLQELMEYPKDFQHEDSVVSWVPDKKLLEVRALGLYKKTYFQKEGTHRQLALGPSSMSLCLSGYSEKVFSGRLVVHSCLDPGVTRLLDIDLAIEPIKVLARHGRASSVVIHLPFKSLAITFMTETSTEASETACLLESAISRVNSGTEFFSLRRSKILELEDIIEKASERHRQWLAERAESQEESDVESNEKSYEKLDKDNVTCDVNDFKEIKEIKAKTDPESRATGFQDLKEDAHTILEENISMSSKKSPEWSSTSGQGLCNGSSAVTLTEDKEDVGDTGSLEVKNDKKGLDKMSRLSAHLDEHLSRLALSREETSLLTETFANLCAQNRQVRESSCFSPSPLS